MSRNLTQDQIKAKIAKINAREPEQASAEDLAAFKAAAEDPGVPLALYKFLKKG